MNPPPSQPPDPSLVNLFPERTPYRAPVNPFQLELPAAVEEEHRYVLSDVLNNLRHPFNHNNEGKFAFCGDKVGVDIPPGTFNSAANMILTALEHGYYPTHDPTMLPPRDWARLACAMLAAIGQGYHHQETLGNTSTLKKVHAGVVDLNPISPEYPTLFHHLTMLVSHLELCISPDADNYLDWYFHIRQKVKCNLT